MQNFEALRWRISSGRTTAVIGSLPSAPDPIEAIDYAAVHCDACEPLGPVLEAVRVMARGSNTEAPPSSRGNRFEALPRGLGRDGGTLDDPSLEVLVRALGRFRARTRHARALLFRNVESADGATLDLLTRVVTHREALPVGLVLQFRTDELEGAARELLATIERFEGPHGVVRNMEQRSGIQSSGSPPEFPGVDSTG